MHATWEFASLYLYTHRPDLDPKALQPGMTRDELLAALNGHGLAKEKTSHFVAAQRLKLIPIGTTMQDVALESGGPDAGRTNVDHSCRNRPISPAAPFACPLSAASSSSRVMPGWSAFGSKSVAMSIKV